MITGSTERGTVRNKNTPSNPCPICGGHNQKKKGIGERCWGFVSDDGKWCHCTRGEAAGPIELNHKSGGYPHRLHGPCKCGVQHGPDLPGTDYPRPPKSRQRKRDQVIPKPKPRPEVPEDVSEVYEDLLRRCTLTEEAEAYFSRRAIGPELLKAYDVTEANEPERIFREMIEAHGREALDRAGLLSEKGLFLFAAGSWRHSILFPFYSSKSFRVEYVQGRRFCSCDRTGTPCNDKHGPSYMFLRNRPKPCAWNDISLASLDARSRVYVTEGIPDALSLIGHGLNAVAVGGVNGLTDTMVRELLRFDVVLAWDRDEKGQEGAQETVKRFEKLGGKAEATIPPEPYKDWNDFFRERAKK